MLLSLQDPIDILGARGIGGTGTGSLVVATRSDNNQPAVFADRAALDAYTATTEGTADAARIRVTNADDAREVFAIGTLTGGQVTAITAAFIRVAGSPDDEWVAVATNLVGDKGDDGDPGPTGPAGATTSFPSVSARDTHYNASQANRDALTTNLVIEVNVGAGNVKKFVWTGVDQPTQAQYLPNEWSDDISLLLGMGSAQLGELTRISGQGDGGLALSDPIQGTKAQVITAPYTDAAGSERPSDPDIGAVTTIAKPANVEDGPRQPVYEFQVTIPSTADPQSALYGAVDLLIRRGSVTYVGDRPAWRRDTIWRGTDTSAPHAFQGFFTVDPAPAPAEQFRGPGPNAADANRAQFDFDVTYTVRLEGFAADKTTPADLQLEVLTGTQVVAQALEVLPRRPKPLARLEDIPADYLESVDLSIAADSTITLTFGRPGSLPDLTASFQLLASGNITLTPDVDNNTITIGGTGGGGTPPPTPISTDLRYGLSSENDPGQVDFGALIDVVSPTDPITVSTGTTQAGDYFHIFTSSTHPIETITDTVLNQVIYQRGASNNVFTLTASARTVAGITYDDLRIGPLNAGVDERYVIAFS